MVARAIQVLKDGRRQLWRQTRGLNDGRQALNHLIVIARLAINLRAVLVVQAYRQILIVELILARGVRF